MIINNKIIKNDNKIMKKLLTTQHDNVIMMLSKAQQNKGGVNVKMNRETHKPYNKLKGFMREKNITIKDLSCLLEISPSTVCSKINGDSDFYLREGNKIIDTYNGSYDIFL